MRLLIVDDHPLFRSGLSAALHKALHADVLEAASVDSALEILQRESDVDATLLDIKLSDGNGLRRIPELRTVSPSTPVIVVSGVEARETAQQAADAGAQGYVPKTATPETIAHAVVKVVDGGQFLSRFGGRGEEPPAPADSANGARDRLTRRQLDVLQIMALGWPNKRIGRQLGISDATVRTHVTSILRALDVENRTAAVIGATRRGWIRPR